MRLFGRKKPEQIAGMEVPAEYVMDEDDEGPSVRVFREFNGEPGPWVVVNKTAVDAELERRVQEWERDAEAKLARGESVDPYDAEADVDVAFNNPANWWQGEVEVEDLPEDWGGIFFKLDPTTRRLVKGSGVGPRDLEN